MSHVAAVLLPLVVLGSVIFVGYRLKFFASPDAEGRYPFLFGATMVIAASLWQTVKVFSDYATWFVVTAYPAIDFAQIVIALLGMVLLVISFSFYADAQESQREATATREDRLRILENLQHDAHRQYQMLELMNLTVKELLTPYPGCAACIFLVNRSRRQLVLGVSAGLSKSETAALEHYSLDRSLVSQAIELGDPMLTGQFELFDREGKSLPSRFTSSIILPLLSGVEKIGAVVLLSSDPQRFDRSEVRSLAPVADWLSEKLYSARLIRELTLARNDRERIAAERAALLDRVAVVFKSFAAIDPIPQFCRGLVGLASCTSAFVCGMQQGRLQFYGGSEPGPDLSENLRTALIEAIDRWKPLVINQEAVDDLGKARVVRSTLVYPIPGADGRDVLIFRKDDAPIAVGTDELEVITVYANLARLLLERRELSRRDLAGRLGFDAVIQLLRGADRSVAFDDDPGFFLRQIGEILPESSLAVTFVRDSSSVLQAKAGFRTNIEELDGIDVHPGEGSIGEACVTGQPRFVCGRREAQDGLELYEPAVKSAFQRLFGERGIPSFIAACPLVDADNVRGVATLFLFNVSDADAPSWTKLLTLASGLYSFRLTVSSLQSLSRAASAADSDRNHLLPMVNELNNHLSAVIGTAELAGQRVDIAGDLRIQLKNIIDEAQRAAVVARSAVAGSLSRESSLPEAPQADSIRDAVETVLAKARISGNLYMAGGRPREITCAFDSPAPLLFSSDSIRSLFESVLDRFATYTADDDVISLVSYRNDKFVFLDLCRHRKNFPPVEPVAHFGDYQTAEQAFRNRPADVYLRQASESPCWYAVDTAAPSPAFLSFKFPIRDGGPRASTSGAKTSIRILAIDDQPVILDLISAMCQSLGYQIVTAGSGDEGTRLAGQGHFDIVLTDLAMPDISGLEVARRIRKIQPDIPIILVTGWEATLDKAQLNAAGVTDVLYKPFRIEQLTDLVQAAAVKRS